MPDKKTLNQSREDKHFTETWHRDQLKLGLPSKLPRSLVNEVRNVREEVYREYQRTQRNKKIKAAVIMAATMAGVVYLILSFGLKA